MSPDASSDADTGGTSGSSNLARQVTHDVRNVAAAIQGSLRLLAEYPLTEEVRALAASALRSTNLLRDMLEGALVEQGAIPVQPVETSTSDIRRALLDVLGGEANRKGLQFTVTTAGYQGRILLPFQAVLQVLMNLAHNAVKQTQSGGVRLLLEVVDTSEGCRLQAWLSDTGPGLPAGLLHTLGPDPDRGSRTDFLTGTGLGLRGSLMLLNMMKGKIAASNPEAGGAQFEIQLPTQRASGNHPLEPVMSDVLVLSADATLQSTLYAVPGVRVIALDTLANSRALAAALRMLPPRAKRILVADLNSIGGITSAESLPAIVGEIDRQCELIAVTDASFSALATAGYRAAVGRVSTVPEWHALLMSLRDRADEVVTIADNAHQASASVLAGKHVLVADDSPEFLQYAVEVLRHLGARTTAVETLQQAYVELNRPDSGIDIAILDYHTLTETADLIIRRYRLLEAQHRAKALPILVMSAEAEAVLYEALRKCGASGFLHKPFDTKHVEEAAKALLSGETHFQRRRATDLPQPEQPARAGQLDTIKAAMARSFYEAFPRQVEEIVNRADAGEHEAVAGMLHKMVGSASLLRFEGLTAVCKEGLDLARANGDLNQWCDRFLAEADALTRSPSVS